MSNRTELATPMESYVVRIYRRDEAEPQQIVGLVEYPESGLTERFAHAAELMKILLSPGRAETGVMPGIEGSNRRDPGPGLDRREAGTVPLSQSIDQNNRIIRSTTRRRHYVRP